MNLTGNIYKVAGPGPAKFWYVLAHTDRGICICLGLDEEGEVQSCTKYQQHYLMRKNPVGHVPVGDIGFADDM
jgi:hypothetical protein